MKNNKGFSLVELIIVIAIMAILVGVMAPQLIKYIEKSKVSADVQLCDTVRTAITTSCMDPDVVQASSSGIPTAAGGCTYSSDNSPFGESVKAILGTATPATQLKSTTAGTAALSFDIKDGNQITVYVTGTTIGAGPDKSKY